MKSSRYAALLCIGLLIPIQVIASEYIGQESRSIKALSDKDIDDLHKGRGWGLAKPAELNGLPGPIHLLELKDALALSHDQVDQVTSLYTSMNLQARQIGARYIELERQIDTLLTQSDVNEETLSIAVKGAATTLAELRLTHLKAHLATPALLSNDQLTKYHVLRGYSYYDPCSVIPEGHDPDMWKRHNNCT